MKNRKSNGELFTTTLIDEVWNKAEIINHLDKNEFRKDICGALIKRDLFDTCNTKLSMAWKIDHIKPIEIGGRDTINNLQALQWENKENKKNNYPYWTCKVKEVGNENDYI